MEEPRGSVYTKERALRKKEEQLRGEKGLLQEDLLEVKRLTRGSGSHGDMQKQEWLDERTQLEDQIKDVNIEIQAVKQEIASEIANEKTSAAREGFNVDNAKIGMLEAANATFQNGLREVVQNIKRKRAIIVLTNTTKPKEMTRNSAREVVMGARDLFVDVLRELAKTVKIPCVDDKILRGVSDPSCLTIIGEKGSGIRFDESDNCQVFRMCSYIEFFLSSGKCGIEACVLRSSIPKKRATAESETHRNLCELIGFVQYHKYIGHSEGSSNKKVSLRDAPCQSSNILMPDRRMDLCIMQQDADNGICEAPLVPIEIKGCDKHKKLAENDLITKLVGPTWVEYIFNGAECVYGVGVTPGTFAVYRLAREHPNEAKCCEVWQCLRKDYADEFRYRVDMAYAVMAVAVLNAIEFDKFRVQRLTWELPSWRIEFAGDYNQDSSQGSSQSRKRSKSPNLQNAGQKKARKVANPKAMQTLVDKLYYVLPQTNKTEYTREQRVALRLPPRSALATKKQSDQSVVRPITKNRFAWVEKSFSADWWSDEPTPYDVIPENAWCAHLIRELKAGDPRRQCPILPLSAHAVEGEPQREVRLLEPVGISIAYAMTNIRALLRITEDIICALQCLHAHDFVHRDISVTNIVAVRDGKRSENAFKYVLIDIDEARQLITESSLNCAYIPPDRNRVAPHIVRSGFFTPEEFNVNTEGYIWFPKNDLQQFFRNILLYDLVLDSCYQTFKGKPEKKDFVTMVKAMQGAIAAAHNVDARNLIRPCGVELVLRTNKRQKLCECRIAEQRARENEARRKAATSNEEAQKLRREAVEFLMNKNQSEHEDGIPKIIFPVAKSAM